MWYVEAETAMNNQLSKVCNSKWEAIQILKKWKNELPYKERITIKNETVDKLFG